jgi:hypothetical protein
VKKKEAFSRAFLSQYIITFTLEQSNNSLWPFDGIFIMRFYALFLSGEKITFNHNLS